MQSTNKIKTVKSFFFLSLLLILPLLLFSQRREDEEMPKLIQPLKSISNLKGWSKNNIGKWYESNVLSLGNQQVYKIDIGKITYENKNYLCVARFIKYLQVFRGTKFITYEAKFWVLDSTKRKDISHLDTSVTERLYQDYIISEIGGKLKPITWNDIIVRTKECFIGTYPNEMDTSARETDRIFKELYDKKDTMNFDTYKDFFIKYRYDYKFNKVQFTIGTFEEAELLYIDKGNDDLESSYFEVPQNLFSNCFKRILE